MSYKYNADFSGNQAEYDFKSLLNNRYEKHRVNQTNKLDKPYKFVDNNTG